MRDVTKMSDRQLVRLYRILHKRVSLWLCGGCQYGWDMPTLSVLYPETAALIGAVRKEGRLRGL